MTVTEQSRAVYPDADGFVERDGVRVYWERYGSRAPAYLLLPTWEIVHSRTWKGQIPYLALHGTAVTFDPRGNGRSDRPRDPALYARREYAEDAVAVLDAAGVERALVVSWCDLGEALILASEHPERVAGVVAIAPAVQVADMPPEPVAYSFDEPLDTDADWAKENRHYWLRDWGGYAQFFFGECFGEPHSTKQIEDAVGWAFETDPETMLLSFRGWNDKVIDRAEATAHARGIACPGVVIHGTDDRLVEAGRGRAVAETLGWQHVSLDGAGHGPHARDPVRTNLLLREAGRAVAGTAPAGDRRWTRALGRPKRALYISSPIGLGHASRDVAIADELRALHPDLEIDWLAQDPVTRVLEARGERIHPASADLASESAHIASESGGHDLNAFQAIRRMDEVLIANFMIFQDAVEEGGYELVIADEAWDIDHHWHEHPELKRAKLAWFTDFVGYVPMPAGGAHEAFLTTDYKAEMIEHVERHPGVRDRAIFVGTPADIVPLSFGKDLPDMRDWVPRHFDFAGYIIGEHPATFGSRAELRASLGYRPDERVCIVTVGGSGVGTHLIRRILQSYPTARAKVENLRMVLVAGPRIDPASLGAPAGVEVRAFVPNLDRHLAACDLALVQGGLTTCMELAAAGTPFLYFPLRNHFEQNVHVAHRLDRYRAGRRMDYASSSPDQIAEAMVAALQAPGRGERVEADGAARAAAMLAELL